MTAPSGTRWTPTRGRWWVDSREPTVQVFGTVEGMSWPVGREPGWLAELAPSEWIDRAKQLVAAVEAAGSPAPS